MIEYAVTRCSMLYLAGWLSTSTVRKCWVAVKFQPLCVMYLPGFMFRYKDELFKMWMFAAKQGKEWERQELLRLHLVFDLEQVEQICVEACLSNNNNLAIVPYIQFAVCASAVRRQRLVRYMKYIVAGSVAYGAIRHSLPVDKTYLDSIVVGLLTGVNAGCYVRAESRCGEQ